MEELARLWRKDRLGLMDYKSGSQEFSAAPCQGPQCGPCPLNPCRVEAKLYKGDLERY